MQERVKQIYSDKQSAVVRVIGMKRPEDPELRPEWNIGTGFFISRDGYVITNAFVSADVTDLWIEMQSKRYEALLIGHDSVTNLSVLKVKDLPSEVAYLILDEVSDLPDPGTMLVALSYPLGIDIELSTGFVTGVGIELFGVSLPTMYLRSNILSYGGEMGAPVFDLNGKLIGIKMDALMGLKEVPGSITGNMGSLILPSRAAMRVRDDLIFSGKVAYGSIGMRPDMDEIEKTGKMIVGSVDQDSPGTYAGLKPGDEILEFNQCKIRTLNDFCNAKFFARPGQYVNMKVKRSGRELNLTIKMDESPSPFLVDIEKITKKNTEEKTIVVQDEKILTLSSSTNEPKL